jgi:hypothetical protein
MDMTNPDRQQLGALHYAGGLMLSAGSSSRFGGLSGLVAAPDAAGGGLTITAISDEGQIFRFHAALDAAGRLADAGGLQEAPLREDGAPLGRAKDRGDAEDIAQADGQTFVSFEYDNRVLAFDDPFEPQGGVRRLGLPAAALALPKETGLEAVAVVRRDGRAMLALGAEDGRAWLCPIQTAADPDCRQILSRPPARFFRLTSLAALPGSDDFVALYRAFDPIRGWRARVEHLALRDGVYRSETLAKLSPPLTMDNMEGLAVLPSANGAGWRLYLISDDNFRDEERTLLLAFDWKP